MFYFRGGCGPQSKPTDNQEDEFGWWLSDQPIAENPRRPNSSCPSQSGSSQSMVSCEDFEENYALAYDSSNEKSDDFRENERIELRPLRQIDDEDIDCLRENVGRHFSRGTSSYSDGPDSCSEHLRGTCYTPDRLIRSEAYKILIPPPRFHVDKVTSLLSPRGIEESRRRKLAKLIDPKSIGASQLETLLNSKSGRGETKAPLAQEQNPRRPPKERDNRLLRPSPQDSGRRESPIRYQTHNLVSVSSSSERLGDYSEEDDLKHHRSSNEDTSGIHSNDWSSEAPTDTSFMHTPRRLSDDLASSVLGYTTSPEKQGKMAVNEVVSILANMETSPERAAILLEEDRFHDARSGHDHLTRLALSIEPDGNVPGVPGDPEGLLRQLRGKVKRLQDSNKDIHREICLLRSDFLQDEWRVANLSEDADKLGNDVVEMKYLDDLLKLLQGELEELSNRNWPFVLGHENPRTDNVNLVV